MNSQKMLENMSMVSSENTGSYYMCNYYEKTGEIPFCLHDCNGCMFHEEDEDDGEDKGEK